MNPQLADLKPLNENRSPMVGVKGYKFSQMGHFARDCAKRKLQWFKPYKRIRRTVLHLVWPSGKLGCDCNELPESAQETKRKWDAYKKKLKQDAEEAKEESTSPLIF